MTTMASCLSVDQRCVCHAYLMSDSRISWIPRTDHGNYFDKATKLFCIGNGPDVLGYCGDSLFGSLALHGLSSYLSHSRAFVRSDDIDNKLAVLERQLAQILSAYPENCLSSGFQMAYLARVREEYYLYEYTYDRYRGRFRSLNRSSVSQDTSALLFVWGSGAGVYEDIKNAMVSANGCRAGVYYRAFVKAIQSGRDLNTGGAPQVVQLRPVGPARSIGVYYRGSSYLCGLQHSATDIEGNIEYRDEYFDIVDSNGHVRHGRHPSRFVE